MGLHVLSLENIPETTNRDYFIYLLDYGWDEPIRNALRDNFDEMARKSAPNRAVIIKGTDIGHFESEVFSWHKINGCPADDVLPALLITNKHPRYFRESNHPFIMDKELYKEDDKKDMKLILIPFKKFCKNPSDVATLIQKIFRDISDKKDLRDFKICKEMKKGVGKAIFDALILAPNISGVGVDLKKFIGP
jgi:hypothetical protein